MILKYINIENYKTVRQVIDNEFNISANFLVKLKRNKRIYLNYSPTYIDNSINKFDTITIDIDFDEDNSNIIAKKMSLDILFEDDSMLIINKPAGIPVHPSILHYENSLSNGVKYYFNNINIQKKIRPVNRLDRNTSGIVIFAKNQYIQERLSNQMQSKIFKKEYIALCTGKFEQKQGTINAPIARKKNSIIERCIDSLGDMSITHYKVLDEFSFESISKLLITLETGRTHQIRVHMAYIGHPILGDSLYGVESDLISRQALHAYKISFVHPITKKQIQIVAPIPKDIKYIIDYNIN